MSQNYNLSFDYVGHIENIANKQISITNQAALFLEFSLQFHTVKRKWLYARTVINQLVSKSMRMASTIASGAR